MAELQADIPLLWTSGNPLTELNVYLNQNLKHLLEMERNDGEAGKRNLMLQSQLKESRIQIVKLVQGYAHTLAQIYGILVTSPGQLVELLENYTHPNAIGALINANLVAPLGLGPDDEDFVSHELRWLFSAAHHHQQVFKSVQKALIQHRKKFTDQGLPSSRVTSVLIQQLPEIRQQAIEQSAPVSIVFHPDTQRLVEADNHLRGVLDDGELASYFKISERVQLIAGLEKENVVRPLLDRLTSALNNLDTLLEREVNMGEEGKRNLQLQNNIGQNKAEITSTLQELADLMGKAYGIFVSSPEQLAQLLSQ